MSSVRLAISPKQVIIIIPTQGPNKLSVSVLEKPILNKIPEIYALLNIHNLK